MAFFESNCGGRDSLLILKRWLENRNRNKTFVDYFCECNYKQIAICDAGDIGMLLFEEIKNSEMDIS